MAEQIVTNPYKDQETFQAFLVFAKCIESKQGIEERNFWMEIYKEKFEGGEKR